MTEALTKRSCTRCGHEWFPRQPKPPKACPACRSTYWNRERTREDWPKEKWAKRRDVPEAE